MGVNGKDVESDSEDDNSNEKYGNNKDLEDMESYIKNLQQGLVNENCI